MSSLLPLLIFPVRPSIPDNSLKCEVELKEPRANGDGVVDVVLVALNLCQRANSGDNER